MNRRMNLLNPGTAQLRLRGLFVMAFVCAGCVLLPPPVAATPGLEVGVPAGPSAGSGYGFGPPLPFPLTVLRRFDPPAQPWLAGNRGVDLAATAGEPVFAAAGGTVIYAGELAGRGVLSITHGSVRTTYEPIDPVVVAGDEVLKGQLVGHVSSVADGCGPPGGCLHWGALRQRQYVDPMALLGPPRVRLLPIWG